MKPKKEDYKVYLQGSLDFPVMLTIRDEGVEMGSTFFTWDQNDQLIKMLKAAKAIGKKRSRKPKKESAT